MKRGEDFALSERCQNVVRTLSERCQNAVRTARSLSEQVRELHKPGSVRSLSLIPPVMLGARSWKLRSQGGEPIPLGNQLSGAVGGRASGALISTDKASLRAVFRGGSVVDGCGTAAQTVLRRCLRLLRWAACCSLRWRRTRLVTHQGLMLWRDVRRMRPGGERACVTTLLEMPFGAQRQNF